jgi:hypothetical protein
MKTILLAAALTLAAGTVIAQPGDPGAGNSFPAGFSAGDLNAQTAKRQQNYVTEHEKAVAAERARQQPNTISVAPQPRGAGG